MDNYFCHILLVMQIGPKTLWEKIAQECEYQGVGILRVVLEPMSYMKNVELNQ
jgi:hypothetical protein